MRGETNKFSVWKLKAAAFVTVLAVALCPTVASATVILENVDAIQQLNDSTRFYNKTVAQLIYDESKEHSLNPRLILTILQRESAAITQSTPSSQTRAAWPMFYNYDERMADCLNGDEASCNDSKYNHPTYRERAYDYGGVGQQIAYSSYNFQRLYTLYTSNYSDTINIDGQNINCANIATRLLYAYTPHLVSYDTNSAFYTKWVAWWGGTPNGGAYAANNIISNDNFGFSEQMSATDINNFLVAQGSWLANYTIPQYISVPYPVVYVAPAPPARKSGDANGDSAVDLLDLSLVASFWGTNNGDSDFNKDGIVDLLDLSILASAWGS